MIGLAWVSFVKLLAVRVLSTIPADEAEPFIDQGFPDKRFPRLQILTIEEVFAGKKIDFPTWWSQDTFKKSTRRRKNNPEESQNNLLKELQEPYDAGGPGSGFRE